MKLRRGELVSILIVVLLFTAVLFILPVMPERVITHWGMNGQPNGWMTKTTAMFILPVMSVFILLLFMVLTRIEPVRSSMESFAAAFDLFINAFLVFMAYICAIMAASNLNAGFDFRAAMAPAFAGLFYAVALMIEKTKPNIVIGIRTKETLSDPEVWEKVHSKGGELFRYCALLSLGGLLFPKLLIIFMLAPLFVTTVYLAAYAKKIAKHE